jgi:hypothetical protein
LAQIICKPKILPLKSASLLKQEQLAKQAQDLLGEESEGGGGGK